MADGRSRQVRRREGSMGWVAWAERRRGGAKTGHLPLGEGDGDGLMGKGHDLLKQ